MRVRHLALMVAAALGFALAAGTEALAVGKPSWYAATRHGSAFRNVRDFGAKGDGVADDTIAIQAAIDRDRGIEYEKKPAVVFLPPGTYRISDTLILWKWTHLVGDASSPPTIVLSGSSPGFDNPARKKPAITTTNGWCVDPKTRNWPANSDKLGASANNTFFIQIHNLNVRLEAGNPGAVGILWRVAQATSIRKVRIEAGDAAVGLDVGGGTDYAAFDQPPSQGGGGTIENVAIVGGRIGLRAWGSQWLFRSVHLRGQSEVGVQVHECWNFDFVDLQIQDAPLGLLVERCMVVLVLDSGFRGISAGQAIKTDGSALYLEAVTCDGVARIVDDKLPGDANGRTMVAGWFQGSEAVAGSAASRAASGSFIPQPRKPLPLRPRPDLDDTSIVNAFDCGARGDGVADDTEALRRAIAGHRTVFLPYGRYKVSDTLLLRADTRLIGEGLPELFLAENANGFGDGATPKALIETPEDARAKCVLAGLWVGAGEGNPGAILVDWRCGEQSGIWDTHLLTNLKGAIYCHLRLTGHGGGLFSNMWNPGGADEAGFIGESQGPAWFYNTPFEHHSQFAYLLHGAANYTFVTAQTEQSPVALRMDKCRNIALYGILYTYWGQMQPCQAQVTDCPGTWLAGVAGHNSETLIQVTARKAPPVDVPGGTGWHQLTVGRF